MSSSASVTAPLPLSNLAPTTPDGARCARTCVYRRGATKTRGVMLRALSGAKDGYREDVRETCDAIQPSLWTVLRTTWGRLVDTSRRLSTVCGQPGGQLTDSAP